MLPRQVGEELSRKENAEKLERIYACGSREAAARAKRLAHAAEEFEKLYGREENVAVFSAPGRTEVGGNHTDHQGGRVLAAGVDLDAVAVAARTENGEIRVQSEGFPEDALNAGDLGRKPGETGGSKALIRGICAGFRKRGYPVGGFRAYTTSEVLSGSGLSSSAAFEVLIGTVISGLYCGSKVPPLVIAQIGQEAENAYFGKPCGLMDQTASSVGGLIAIDFRNAEQPEVEKIGFDFSRCGCSLCIIDTAGSHADLTPDYAAIPAEMKRVAAFFGKEVLSQVGEDEFYANIRSLRAKTGDRAVLRAIHFFGENARVGKEVEALKAGDFGTFQKLVVESGYSSYMYLQNVFSPSHVQEQGVSLALALCERLLRPVGGAYRVHGGGFAGTVQAFVPDGCLPEFVKTMEAALGKGSCHTLSIRPAGGIRIL